MCQDCWNRRGAPKIVTAKTLEAAHLIADVYCVTNAGGYLHIAVDDWNLDDDDIQWCRDNMDTPPDYMLGRKPTPEEIGCADVLLKLTEEERASALAIYDGFFTPQPTKVKPK